MDDSKRDPNIVAGAFAGALGGVVGGAVKLLCEKIAPPRPPGREAPPGVLAAKLTRAVADTDLTKKQREQTANVVHWVFSIATSAMYGALVEEWPPARSGFGTAYGTFVWASFHEVTLPLLGGTPPLPELPKSEQLNEFMSHALFGASVEGVRSLLRR